MALHVGDVGAIIRLTSTTTLTSPTDLKIYYTKPSGTKGAWTAVASGTTNIQYTTTAAGDLDEAGKWSFQGYAAISGWTGRSTQVTEQVERIIATT
jgi:hypothetical protein